MPSAVGLIADSYKAPTAGGPPLTGLQGWWDATDAAAFTYSSGAVVSQWNDRSGNGWHATQTDVPRQPTREVAINGLYAVKCLSGALLTSLPSQNKPLTVAAVARTSTNLSPLALVGRSLNAGGDGNFVIDMSAGKYRCLKYAVALIGSSTNAVAADTNHVITFTYSNAGAWAFYNNGTANGSGTNNQTPTTATLSIGGAIAQFAAAGNTYNGHIGEVLHYNSVLSGADLTSLHTYLRTKWGTP